MTKNIAKTVDMITPEHWKFDLNTSLHILSQVLNLIDSKDSTCIVLNFENVNYISTSGIGLLLDILHITYKADITFSLRNVCTEIYEVLEATQVTRVINIETN